MHICEIEYVTAPEFETYFKDLFQGGNQANLTNNATCNLMSSVIHNCLLLSCVTANEGNRIHVAAEM